MSGDFARRWIDRFIADFELEKERLGELDRKAGDGDFAVNLAQALKRTSIGCTKLGSDPSAAQIFAAASSGFLHTGGTSGPLLGMWLRDVSRAWTDQPDALAAIAAGFAAGTATVQRLGGAQPGDKTMVDAMLPAVGALEQAQRAGVDLTSALVEAALAAERGAAETAHMTASLGRASYVGEAAAGVTDPGAAAIALFFRSGHQASMGF